MDKSCACQKCQSECLHNPGWFTPEEAAKAIAAGYARKLMRDWLEPSSKLGNEDRIYLLAPAARGCEGDDAPELEFDFVEIIFNGLSKGRCVFFDKNGRCELYDSGFKPIQCRTALMCGPCDGYQGNYAVAKLWATPEARRLVEKWEKMMEKV